MKNDPNAKRGHSKEYPPLFFASLAEAGKHSTLAFASLFLIKKSYSVHLYKHALRHLQYQ